MAIAFKSSQGDLGSTQPNIETDILILWFMCEGLDFNPSHIDQWMRMFVSNSHRGQATSLWRQLPVIVKVKVWRHKTLQFWGFLLGESTYFIGFMLPTFGIICKLGGFCGPFGPRVWKFAFFDIILLKLKYLPSMSCDIEGRRLWGQIFVMYSVHYKYLPSKSSALKVVCPQSRLPSKSSALKVVGSMSWAQRRLPSMSHSHSP